MMKKCLNYYFQNKRLRSWLIIIPCLLSACVNYSHFYTGMNDFRMQNYRAAFIHLQPEAVKGQPDAQYAVGFMYYYGQGVIEDRKKAWYWIQKAAKAGQPEALAAAKILLQGKK